MDAINAPRPLPVLLERLHTALQRGASEQTCLRRWSEFIRARDEYQCVLCGNERGLTAHHICRKTFLPEARFQTGNGISLCRICHAEAHAGFNGRPDLQEPMDGEGGEKIEILSDLYIALFRDSVEKAYDREDYYFLDDQVLAKFKLFQTFEWDTPFAGTRIAQAATIWDASPPLLMRLLIEANQPASSRSADRSMLSIVSSSERPFPRYSFDQNQHGHRGNAKRSRKLRRRRPSSTSG